MSHTQSQDAEAGLLCCCFHDPERVVAMAVDAGCTSNWFTIPAHTHVWDAIIAVRRAGKPVEEIAVLEELSNSGAVDLVGGTAGLLSIISRVPTALYAQSYCDTLANRASQRQLRDACAQAMELVSRKGEDASTVVERVLMPVIRSVGTTGPLERLRGEDLEERLIAAVFSRPGTLGVALELGADESIFVAGKALTVWRAIVACAQRGMPPTQQAVRDVLASRNELSGLGGDEYLRRIARLPAEKYEPLLDGLREKASLRAILEMTNEIRRKVRNGSKFTEIVSDIGRCVASNPGAQRERTWAEVGVELREQMRKRLQGERDFGVCDTGLPTFDRYAGVLKRGEYAILAARPSVGKSALAGWVALQAALASRRVAFFSLETGNCSLMQRMCSQASQVSWEEYPTTHAKSRADYEKAQLSIASLTNFHAYERHRSLLSIMTQVRLLASAAQLDLLVVDYIQLVTPPKANSREEQVAAMSRAFKELTAEIGCASVVLAQLNRNIEHDGDRAPRLSDLRESGSLEQDADVVWFLHRPRNGPDGTPQIPDSGAPPRRVNVKLIQAKKRNGDLFAQDTVFDRPTMRFFEVAQPSAEWPREN